MRAQQEQKNSGRERGQVEGSSRANKNGSRARRERAKRVEGCDNRNMERVKPLVLLVEDQSELRQMYVQQLALSGFDVIEAENGIDALTNTAAHSPDVVLMDLSLPVLDGWEATRR